MSYSDVIADIQNLPHYREYTCKKCGHKQKVFILRIQPSCIECGNRSKLRGYAAQGSEVEDVIDAVLNWLGTGSEFEEAMKWKQVLDSFEE